jgi:hypothetical protein
MPDLAEQRPVPGGQSAQQGPPPSGDVPGQRLAVLAESLYLVNLLLLPGVAFAALVWLVLRHARGAPALARQHLYQALSASLWAGLLLVLVSLVILLLGGRGGVSTWVIVIVYFTFVHATLVLLGIFALSKALSAQTWHMPLIGRFPIVHEQLDTDD